MKKKLIIVFLCLIVIGSSIFYILKNNNNSVAIEDVHNIEIEISNNEKSVDYNSIDQTIALEDTYYIKSGGVYSFSGTLSNGQIIVEAKDEDVTIILDGVNITCQNSSPIYVKKAKKVIINVKENSINTLIDSTKYDVSSDDEPNGTIFSTSDLIINGSGKLFITSNYQDAIVSKDGLKIINTNIDIKSVDDGIRGKDYVVLSNANINLEVDGNGIKSTNDTDNSLGYIIIDGGNIIINAGLDGIQAETNMQINNGNLNITTGGGSSNASINNDWGKWHTDNTTSESAKALKAGLSILINNGTATINSSDDAIHSNGSIVINNGSFEISSGDDGIHADNGISINNGIINITKSYEGIEGTIINIAGGTINVVASDDGMNVAGGVDSSSQHRPGANEFVTNSENKLTITGGNIIVKASGDGLDSNGDIEMSNGNVLVYGPTNSGNGALDYNGKFTITGGVLVASGSSGMAQSVSSTSTQNTVMVTFNAVQPSNSVVTINDSNGTILTFNSIKTYQTIVVSTPKLVKNNSYNIYVDNNLIDSFKISNTLTTIGESRGMNAPQRR